MYGCMETLRAESIKVRDFENEPMPNPSKDLKMFDPYRASSHMHDPQKNYGLRISKGSSC